MIIKSIQTNAKTPSDTVILQLRQEKKVSNHKNQRNEDPTAGAARARRAASRWRPRPDPGVDHLKSDICPFKKRRAYMMK